MKVTIEYYTYQFDVSGGFNQVEFDRILNEKGKFGWELTAIHGMSEIKPGVSLNGKPNIKTFLLLIFSKYNQHEIKG